MKHLLKNLTLRNLFSVSNILNFIVIFLFITSVSIFVYLTFYKPTDTYSNRDQLILTTVSGEKIDFNTLKGNVVLLNFWATWCPPCRLEIPELNNIYSAFENENFKLIGVSYDDDVSTVLNFKSRTPIYYPVVMSSNQLSSKFGEIAAVPTTIILDKQLNVYAVLEGFHSQADIEPIIAKLLNDPI